MRRALAAGVLLLAGFAHATELAGVDNSNRARINYMLNCQGCHGANGAGTADGSVPKMNDFLGNFLHVKGGRDFLVQVPGSANAALSDDALAEVLNWMLGTLSAGELPSAFEPFTAEEVGRLRATPLTDVTQTRDALIQRIELISRTED